MPARPELIARREFEGRVDPTSAGSWLTKSAMLFVGEVLRISSCVATVSGVGDLKPSRTMRVPVTMMSSGAMSPGLVSGGGGLASAGAAGVVCAKAGAASAIDKAVNAVPVAINLRHDPSVICNPPYSRSS